MKNKNNPMKNNKKPEDQKLFVELDGLKVQVEVVRDRMIFGRHEYEVIPLAGSGSKWVNEESLLRVDPNLKEKVV